MEYNFSKPNIGNVNVGDLLIIESNEDLRFIPIKEVRLYGVETIEYSQQKDSTNSITNGYPYIRAIIKKKNGEILVGESVEKLERVLFNKFIKNLEKITNKIN
jgi:hypothetical protein